jgi:pilus assembly protein CpaC
MKTRLLVLCLLAAWSGARADAGLSCSGKAAAPARLALTLGKSTLMKLPEPVRQRSVGNPEVLRALLVAPDTLYLLGADIGTTNMIIQGKSGECNVLDVEVGIDSAGLSAALTSGLPQETAIRVQVAGDSVMLTGTVHDPSAIARASEIAMLFMRRPAQATRSGDKDKEKQAEKGGQAVDRIVNMLSVAGPQQVMLEVKVAEVAKTLLERIDTSAAWTMTSGSWAATLVTDFLSGRTNGSLALRKSNGNGFDIRAQKQDSQVRILAEPVLAALSGQEANFLAGGKILIPVSVEKDVIRLEEKEFGVSVRFTPTVLAGGRINLRVSPEVSELSREGVGVSAGSSLFGGLAVLPLITTRRASTTVQLEDGQSFAIGGLIKNNMVNNLRGLPVLGEIPILGALFRSSDYQLDRTELVFVVTARLVKPVAAAAMLPTTRIEAPTRSDQHLRGQLEHSAHPSMSSSTPATDASFGQSVSAAMSAQLVYPKVVPKDGPEGLDGRSARAAVERYEKSQSAPRQEQASVKESFK